MRLRRTLLVVGFSFLLTWGWVNAQDATPSAEEPMSEEALVAHGEYVAYISGCVACHTPQKVEYSNRDTLTDEQRQDLSLARHKSLDIENRLMAGGRGFNLGPLGTLVANNLTPDEATGLGSWTDAEIEAAIRVGVGREARRLHPLMPYTRYFYMSDEDMVALIAYLRAIPAVENKIEPSVIPTDDLAPELGNAEDIPTTTPTDPVERGEYLINIMRCSGCHTPLDPETGLANVSLEYAGGQAYEGPWGIVYGGNITPDSATGLGDWTDEQILRAIQHGVRIDNRRLVLMPWQDYNPLTEEDGAALVAYLRSLPAIDNEVPLPSVTELFAVYAEE